MNMEMEVLKRSWALFHLEAKKRSGVFGRKTARCMCTGKELQDVSAKCAEYEGRASSSHQRSLELEDLIQTSHSKAEGAEKKAVALELLLKAANYKIQELEEQVSLSDAKCRDVNAESKKQSDRMSELMAELEAFQEKLEEQVKIIEQATARTVELEMLHESLSRDSELKLREAAESFFQRDLEAKDLHEKLKALDDHYKEKAVEAAEREASLKTELEESSSEHATLENALEELNRKTSEAETKFVQSVSENELLSDTNSKLKQQLESHEAKVIELQGLLSSLHVERQAAPEQLAAHSKTISELTDQHSRGLELQSAVESRVREAGQQLHDAIERFKQRDSQAQDLDEKRIVLETQVRILEEQANSSLAAAESQKAELDEAFAKIKNSQLVRPKWMNCKYMNSFTLQRRPSRI